MNLLSRVIAPDPAILCCAWVEEEGRGFVGGSALQKQPTQVPWIRRRRLVFWPRLVAAIAMLADAAASGATVHVAAIVVVWVSMILALRSDYSPAVFEIVAYAILLCVFADIPAMLTSGAAISGLSGVLVTSPARTAAAATAEENPPPAP